MSATSLDTDDVQKAAANASAQLAATAERTFAEATRKFERALHDGLEQLRAQSRTYADTAGQQIDDAQRYVTGRVRERPLAMTGAALGIGVLVGLLMAGGRRR